MGLTYLRYSVFIVQYCLFCCSKQPLFLPTRSVLVSIWVLTVLTVYARCPILCCQIPQSWEVPLLVQIVNLRQQLSKRLSPLTSPPPSFSSLSSCCTAPLTCSCCLSNHSRVNIATFDNVISSQDKHRSTVEIFFFFGGKLDSTCSYHNEFIQTRILEQRGLSMIELHRQCSTCLMEMITESLHFSCQGSLSLALAPHQQQTGGTTYPL